MKKYSRRPASRPASRVSEPSRDYPVIDSGIVLSFEAGEKEIADPSKADTVLIVLPLFKDSDRWDTKSGNRMLARTEWAEALKLADGSTVKLDLRLIVTPPQAAAKPSGKHSRGAVPTPAPASVDTDAIVKAVLAALKAS